MKILVSKNKRLYADDKFIVEGENKTDKLEFEFPTELENYIKFIVIKSDEGNYIDLIIDNEYIITRAISNLHNISIAVICTNSEIISELTKIEDLTDIENEIEFRSLSVDIPNYAFLVDVNTVENDNNPSAIARVYKKTLENTKNIEEIKENQDTLNQSFTKVENSVQAINESNNKLIEKSNKLETSLKTNSDNIQAINENLEEKSDKSSTATKLDMNLNSEDYVLTIALKNNKEQVLSEKSVDFPIESTVIDLGYDEETRELELILKNGNRRKVYVGDLISGLVSEEDFNKSMANFKKEIKTELIDDLNSAINTNYKEKTEAFNQNASDKTTEFNTNADLKEKDFNSNAIQKTDEFNQNAESYKNDIDKLKYKNDKLEKTLESISVKNSISESKIEIDDAIEYRPLNLEMNGEYEQETTKGYQLIKSNTAETQTKNEITFTKNEDGGWTLNGTATTYTSLCIGTYELLGNTEYTLSGGHNSNCFIQIIHLGGGGTATGGANTKTFTQNEEVSGSAYIVINEGTTLNNVTIKPLLYQGVFDSNKKYEKYTEGLASPNMNYPSEAKFVECKNKFVLDKDYSTTDGGITFKYDKSTDTFTCSGIIQKTSFYCTLIFDSSNLPKIKDLYKFKISINNALSDCSMNVYVNNCFGYIARGMTDFKTWQENSQERYAIMIYSNNVEVGTEINESFKVQEEFIEGSFSEGATKYVPYGFIRYANKSTTLSKKIDIWLGKNPLRKAKDACDKLFINTKTGRVWRENKIGELIFNGSENWLIEDNNKRFGYYQIVTNSAMTQNQICNMLGTVRRYVGVQNSFFVEDNNIRLQNDFNLTLDEFKAKLQETNLVVDYELAETEIEELGTLTQEELKQLELFEDYNSISIDNELNPKLDITYLQDTKKYVEKQIAKVQSLILES